MPSALTARGVQGIAVPHFVLGGAGVRELSAADAAGFVARLRIFNPDGSEAELSGNGAREAILYLRRNGWTEADEFAAPVADPSINRHLEGMREKERLARESGLEAISLRFGLFYGPGGTDTMVHMLRKRQLPAFNDHGHVSPWTHLADAAAAVVAAIDRGRPGEAAARQHHRAFVQPDVPGHEIEEGRFAGAGRSHDSEKIAFLDLQVDSPQHVETGRTGGVRLFDIIQYDHYKNSKGAVVSE